MTFRNGNIYRKGKAYRDMVFIKVIRRNSSRTFGMVKFQYHNSSDTNVYSERPQKLKGFRLFNR